MKRAYLAEKPVELATEGRESVRTRLVETGRFDWGPDQEKFFQHIKRAVAENVMTGANPDLQYHLATDASNRCTGAVSDVRVVMFMSFRFEVVETRYSTTEREALAVVRCRAEVQWLLMGSGSPTKVYTRENCEMAGSFVGVRLRNTPSVGALQNDPNSRRVVTNARTLPPSGRGRGPFASRTSRRGICVIICRPGFISGLRRSAQTSRFFGEPLIKLPPNRHSVIRCPLPNEFKQIVNDQTKEINMALANSYQQQHEKWQQMQKAGEASKVNANNWLQRARKMRVWSTFPRLSTLEAASGLSLSGQEDVAKGWRKKVMGKLYDLQPTESPYEQHLDDICSPSHCTKLRELSKVMKNWDKDEKAVKAYLRKSTKAPVALIHAGLPKPKVHTIVGLFRGEKKVVAQNPNDVPPQYMVGTTSLVGVGYTLTKARRLVQLDPEWLQRDEDQARKSINRITQTSQTYTCSLLSIGSDTNMGRVQL
ncbi:hypothetical protein MMC07_006493 [Pseudocyphellaria aurata]|nr:hypothetical protein [Pseudocyphellaria aurata]